MDIMIGDEYADISFLQICHDLLYILYRYRIHPCQGLIQQNKFWICNKCPCDFSPPPLTSGKTVPLVIGNFLQAKLLNKPVSTLFDFRFFQREKLQDRFQILTDGENKKEAGLVRPIDKPHTDSLVHRFPGGNIIVQLEVPFVREDECCQ